MCSFGSFFFCLVALALSGCGRRVCLVVVVDLVVLVWFGICFVWSFCLVVVVGLVVSVWFGVGLRCCCCWFVMFIYHCGFLVVWCCVRFVWLSGCVNLV